MKKKDPKRQRKAVLNHPDESPEGSSEDVKSLRHELNEHQVELKAQTEELQVTLRQLSDARDHYKQLFDSAPIGYLVIDGSFMIREANLTAATLLGTPLKDLIGTALSKLMTRHDADTYYLYLTAVKDRGIRQSCELAFQRSDGSLFHGYLEASPYEDSRFGNGWRIALDDITERKRAETAIEAANKSLEREKDILQSVMNGAKNSHLVYLDREFNFVRVNETYARTCGYKPEDMIGKNHFALYPHDENEAIFARVRDTGIPMEFHDKPFVFPDQPDRGVTYWDWTLTPMFDNAGQVVGLVFSLFETTERKRAEESLHQAHARLEWLARFPEENPSPVMRVSSEGEALYCNRAATELDGWKCIVDQVLSGPILPLVRQAIAGGQVVREDIGLGQRQYAVTVVPIPEEGYANIYGRDISERKRMEEALRKAKVELEERVKERTYELYAESLYARSLIEASLDPLVTISVDGKITDVNHASEEATGVSREQLIGSDFSDYFTEPEEARAGYEEVFRQGFVRDYPLELRRRDGHVTPVLYNASVYRDDTGQILGVFAAARDITERRRVEAALRKLASELVMAEEHERKRIAGVLHDDIAQILASVRMRLDLLQSIPSEHQDKLTLKEAKSLLVQSIQETRALMNDLGNPLLFEMGLKAACESLADRLMEKHPVQIKCDIQDAYKHLSSDVKAFLFQLIRELLTNVVKHSHAGNANVIIDMEDGHFRVKVTDDGVGFDSQTLGTPTVEGGYGLYSIRERLIAVDGSLRIISTPGAGTVVTAILPAALD